MRALFFLLAATLFLSACSSSSGAATELEESGVSLYLPSYGEGFASVTREEGAVRAPLANHPTSAVLWEEKVTEEVSPCQLASRYSLDWSTCTETSDGFRVDFEEWTSVGVLRGDTLLVVTNLVTEGDPEIFRQVTESLRTAPAVSAEDFLGEVK